MAPTTKEPPVETDEGQASTAQMQISHEEHREQFVKSVSRGFREDLLAGWFLATEAVLAPISASRASGSVTFGDEKWDPKKSGGLAEIYGSFTIELAAVMEPVKAKLVKITSADTAVRARPKWMSSRNKGYFTQHGLVMIYPGLPPEARDAMEWSTLDSIELPEGWRRYAIAPKTPNSTTTYQKTTGWSIGATGGVEIAEDPKLTASLQASYSESDSHTVEIPDFRVRNYSSQAVCTWVYEYGRVMDHRGGMFIKQGTGAHTRVENPAALATSTMYMSNEVIYEAPADATGWQPFQFYLQHKVARLWITGSYPFSLKSRYDHEEHGVWRSLMIDMGMVRHP